MIFNNYTVNHVVNSVVKLSSLDTDVTNSGLETGIMYHGQNRGITKPPVTVYQSKCHVIIMTSSFMTHKAPTMLIQRVSHRVK